MTPARRATGSANSQPPSVSFAGTSAKSAPTNSTSSKDRSASHHSSTAKTRDSGHHRDEQPQATVVDWRSRLRINYHPHSEAIEASEQIISPKDVKSGNMPYF